MTRALRHLALLAGAIAMAIGFCAPALAAASSCPMPGCAPSAFGLISPAACCCGAAGAPAQTSGQAGFFPVQVRTPAVSSVPGLPVPGAALMQVAQAATVPPTPVPLFLLNASLLI